MCDTCIHFLFIFIFLREELQDRMRGVYDIQYIYLTTQSVCVWPSEAAGHEYYTVLFSISKLSLFYD